MSESAENYWHDLHDPLNRAAMEMELARALLPEILSVNPDVGPLVHRMRYTPRVTDDTYNERAKRLEELTNGLDAAALASVGITYNDVAHLRDTAVLDWLANTATVIATLAHVTARITGAQIMLTTGRGTHEAVDVHATIDPVLELWDHTLFTHGGRIMRSFAAARTRVRGNTAALARVWSNFIDNALRASTTAERQVTITFATFNAEDQLVVEVRDDGPGIPATLLPTVFDPGVSTRDGGGQGLDYVRRTITAHQGTISVSSGAGDTCFRITLPLHDVSSRTR